MEIIMIEPKLKKKPLFDILFKRQLFLTISTCFLLVVILVGSSYAIFKARVETGLTDVLVRSGNLVATISSESEAITMNYNTLGVIDEVGLSYEPYTFTIKNDGDTAIGYYEIRIVDKEFSNSSLPHKALKYALSINESGYSIPKNLGDNKSYIYVKSGLEPGGVDTFNLKLWVDEKFGEYANNKKLNASIELTLYSDLPTRNYVVYDTGGGNYIPKTSVISGRITSSIPIRKDDTFLGWSTEENGVVNYESDSAYNLANGTVLYAVWDDFISYDLNGGEGEIPKNKVSEGISSTVPTKEGHNFLGWAVASDSEEVFFHPGEPYTGNAITLYAVWELVETE